MHNFAKKIMECAKTNVEAKGLENFSDSELCRLEKWTGIANNIAQYDYNYHITEAMEESKYGDDYDEYGRKGYRGRSATTGRYVHRSYEERMSPDMRYMDGERMGYDMGTSGEHGRSYTRGYEDGMRDGMKQSGKNSNGKFYVAKRGYEEAHENKDTDKEIQHLNEMIDTIKEEITDLLPMMNVTQRSIVRNGLQAVQNKIS